MGGRKLQAQSSMQAQGQTKTSASGESEKFTKYKWHILVVLALAVSIIVLDRTIVNVALPSIMHDLGVSFVNAEWIVNIYTLVYLALLMTTGRIADIVGRRMTLIAGTSVVCVGAIIAGVSPTLPLLLFGRFIQGAGAAIVLPTSLSSINTIYKDKDRILAFAVYGSIVSGMAALGPLLGGVFTTYTTWRWVFWIDLPVGIAIILGSYFWMPETYGEKFVGRFDWLGSIFSAFAFSALVYAFIEGTTYGWWLPKEGYVAWGGISRIPWIFGFGALALILMTIRELGLIRKGKSHLVSLDLFKIRSFAFGNVVSGIVAIGVSGSIFLLSIFLQNALGKTAMQTGWILCVMGIGAFISGALAAPLVRATSTKTVVATGLAFSFFAFLGFYFTIRPNTSITLLVFWLAVYGLGLGLGSSQLTAIIMEDVPDEKAGQASSIKSTIRQLGNAMGVAVVGTLFITFLWGSLPGTFSDLPISQQMQTSIETSIINTGGASIPVIDKRLENMPMTPQEVREAKAESVASVQLYQEKNEERKRIVELVRENAIEGFASSVYKTLGVCSIFLLIGFILTLFLPKDPKDRKPECTQPDCAES